MFHKTKSEYKDRTLPWQVFQCNHQELLKKLTQFLERTEQISDHRKEVRVQELHDICQVQECRVV